MQTIEVDGVKPDTTLVVEAVDRMCPFPGLWGSPNIDEEETGELLALFPSLNGDYPDRPWNNWPAPQ